MPKFYSQNKNYNMQRNVNSEISKLSDLKFPIDIYKLFLSFIFSEKFTSKYNFPCFWWFFLKTVRFREKIGKKVVKRKILNQSVYFDCF